MKHKRELETRYFIFPFFYVQMFNEIGKRYNKYMIESMNKVIRWSYFRCSGGGGVICRLGNKSELID